jgi:hypothetical protein
MHFIHTSLVALSMSVGLASALNNPAACLKLPAVAMNIDMDKGVETIVEEACNKGCSPKLSEFNPKLRNVAVPAIQAETLNMGAPELEKPYTALLDSLFQTVTKECADEQILETDLCENASQVKSIALCVQKRAVALALGNVGTISKLSTTKCQEQVDFWSDPNVHEKAIPYLRQFVADGC